LKFFAVSRGDEASNRITEQFNQLAVQHGLTPDAEAPQVVVSIGGDGTMLSAFHLFAHRLADTCFVGIHTGRLGFYADWMPEELATLVDMIAMSPEQRNGRIVQYPLVEVEIAGRNGIENHLTLNEFTIKGVESTLVAELHVNDERFEMFRGDGICISTPSGSTAYNKSLGGALIHPSIESLQIAEIASINNRVYRTLGSSMVLPKHHHFDIYPQGGRNLLLTLDHLSQQRNDIVSIRASVSDTKVQFVRYRPFPFWSRVREAFIGQESH